MSNDREIWREFIDFRIEECLGLWSERVIDFPFGRMLEMHAEEGPYLFMIGDLDKAKPSEVLAQTEAEVAKVRRNVNFLFSSAWSGDVPAFQAHLRERGYQPAYEQVWLVKDDFSDIDQWSESELTIDTKPDSATVKDLFKRTLNNSEPVAERLKRRLDNNTARIKTGFVVARTASGEAVSFSGYSYAGPICHFHTMGTLKEHRRGGAARHMAKVRYQMMRDRGAKRAIAFAAKENTASLEHAKALGLRVLEEMKIWRKVPKPA